MGEPLRFIAQTGCPNPVFVVDEIDKVGGGMTSSSGTRSNMCDALLPLLDRGSARQFRCPVSGLVCDMSGINWVLTANYVETIPMPLRTRVEVVHVPALSLDDFLEAAEVVCSQDAEVSAAVKDLIRTSFGRSGFSPRHVVRFAERLAMVGSEHPYH
ncbi:AAA family ATPase [Primorskyibacter sp. S187A]|uniref:AAA family ATPase n=1 Tax=Primorskyibacter sp. S187A TaxID=3415130 RepID=UPI003C7DA2DF